VVALAAPHSDGAACDFFVWDLEARRAALTRDDHHLTVKATLDVRKPLARLC
jgi:hypothetical protein